MTDISADSQPEKKDAPPKWGNLFVSPVLLAIIALAFIPILVSLLSTRNLSQRGIAATCKPDECTTSTGCQVRGYRQDGYVCIGSNQWQSPDGQQVIGGPQGPNIPPADQTALPAIPQATSANNLETAKRVLAWTNSLRDANGIYLTNLNCTDNNCTTGIKTNTAGMVALWSRFHSYLASKDPADLQIFENDLNNYLDPQKVASIQGVFWGCKFLYDIWNSNETGIVPYKSKIRDLCLRIINNPQDKQEIDRHISTGQFAEPNVSELKAGRKISSSLSANKDDYTEYAALASEHAIKYLWFSDQKDLQRAKLYFTKAGKLYDSQKPKNTTGDLPTLGIASLDLYRVTRNREYLDFAINLAQSMSASKCKSLIECAVSFIFADDLSQATGDAQYANIKSLSSSELIDKGYDSTKTAFHSLGSASQVVYPLWENLLIAGIYSKSAY